VKKLIKNFYIFIPILLLLGPIYPDLKLDGFPFDNKIEVILFTCFIFIGFNRAKKISNRNITIMTLFLLISISISYFTSLNRFDACYKTKNTPTSNFEMSFNTQENCQFSYKNPLDRKITRYDYVLDFNNNPKTAQGIDLTNWDLYFFNQTGFNFYDKSFYGGQNDLNIDMHWVKRNNQYERVSYNFLQQNNSVELYDYGFKNIVQAFEPSRKWLSFEVSWISKSKLSEQNIFISYVGEGNVRVDNKIVTLPSSYSKVNTLEINIPENSTLEIDFFYRYNAGINSFPNIPYASFVIHGDNLEPVNPLRSPYEKMLELINLAIFLIILLSIFLKVDLEKNILISNFLLILITLLVIEIIPNSLTDYIEIGLISLCIYFIIHKNIKNINYYVGPILSLSILSVKNLNIFNNVQYAVGGSDPLKYESWSQQIVYFSSLQGGEDIFLYQPGYRYLLSLLHLIFGDSHVSIVLFSRTVLITLLLLLFIKISEKTNSLKVFLSFNFLILYIFLSTYSSKLNLFTSLSEWPTWILGVAISILLLKNKYRLIDSTIISTLLGLCFLIRENQLPGLLILSIIFLIRYKSSKLTIRHLTIFSFFLIIPFLHNFVYGGEFVLERNIFRSDVFYLSPIDLLLNFSESKEWLFFQLNFLLSNPLNENVILMAGKIFPLAILIMISTWLLVVFIYLLKNKLSNLEGLLFILLPLSFLTPHIFYQVHTYFPRHIIQGYLFLSVSTILLAIKSSKNELQTNSI
jgi:hypothetical protein